MKIRALNIALIAFFGLMVNGCHGDFLTKEIPGYPLFKANVDAIDYGRVAVKDVAEASLTLQNIGSNDSELYLYYYLEGNEAFRFVFPNHELTLKVEDGPKYIPIAFGPERVGEADGHVVIYYSNYPLADEVDVKTHYIPLSGLGTGTCDYPKKGGAEDHFSPAPALTLNPLQN